MECIAEEREKELFTIVVAHNNKSFFSFYYICNIMFQVQSRYFLEVIVYLGR